MYQKWYHMSFIESKISLIGPAITGFLILVHLLWSLFLLFHLLSLRQPLPLPSLLSFFSLLSLLSALLGDRSKNWQIEKECIRITHRIRRKVKKWAMEGQKTIISGESK